MMLQFVRVGILTGAAVATAAGYLVAQSGASMPPVNQAPNPYQTVENYFKLPAGRTWGSTSAVDIDKDGRTIWVAERCGANSCWDATKNEMSTLDTVLHFDASGNLIKSFGAGMMVFPHGIHVDRDGNVWVTDGNDNLPRRRPGAPADSPMPPAPAKVVGHQVFKFSPDGKLLLTLGKPGGNQPGQTPDPGSFYQPNDVITYPNGDILVAEGHGNAPPSTARLIRFDKSGKFLREFGKMGTGTDGEFMQPHGLAFDSKGRLFVADRNNNRIQILDAETYKTLETWYQFSRLSGIFIDKNDVLYGADSESGSVNPPHGAWMRGMRVGSIKDGGKVTAFIPDPTSVGETFSMVDGKAVMKKADGSPGATGTLAAEGVAVDAAGNIYGAEVGPKAVKKYVKK
ncbi:MAG TPA: peptidyl-alpha-hydroxyglycine alpha-amidating lyase family protein [Vicinamibacterales bacterium]|jgi:sugar lactone lactonase YvrE|nr:peptidyl-alpha-hydroxyglycine alpha-amidating lyase family protein [Vicinamibacterales bacterium]